MKINVGVPRLEEAGLTSSRYAGSNPATRLWLVCMALTLSGCAGTPAAKLGDSMAHGIGTVGRYLSSTVGNGDLISVDIPPGIVVHIGDFWNRPIVSQQVQPAL